MEKKLKVKCECKKFTKYCEACGVRTFSFEPGLYGWEGGLCDLCWDKRHKKLVKVGKLEVSTL